MVVFWEHGRAMKTVCLLLGLILSMSQVSAEVIVPVRSKKGACITAKKDDWRAKVGSLNVSWHYSWGAEIPDRMPHDTEFVPMVLGY